MDFKDENIEWLMESSASVEKVVAGDAANKMRAGEERQLSLFLKVLRASFKSEPQIIGPKVFGVLTTEEDYQALMRKFKALGYFFSIRTSRTKKDCYETKFFMKGPSETNNEHPYVIDKCIRLYCSSGRQNNKEGVRRSWPTDCKAEMTVRHVRVFSRVRTPKDKDRRLNMLRKLRQALTDGTASPDEELWVWVSLPKMHHHPHQLPGRMIDAEVKAAMHGLVQGQQLTTEQVKEKLKDLVEKEFAQGPVKPALDNSAFFPSERVIYNHLRHDGLAKKRRRQSSDVNGVRRETMDMLSNLQRSLERCCDIRTLKTIASFLKQMQDIVPLPPVPETIDGQT